MAEAFDRLTSALDAAGPITVVATIDHAANAAGVGLSLRPTREVFFGNPALGTPLMQRNQLAGIDLPQHIVAYENRVEQTYLIYNSVAYLMARHGLAGVPTLPTIRGALANFVEPLTIGAIKRNERKSVMTGEGLVSVVSAFDVDQTFANLKSIVEAAGPLTVLFELDHQANAASAGLTLRPTRLLVFGNPALGTPLMQDQRPVAIDLPQRVLVWEDEAGVVRLTYNDPFYLAERHELDSSLPQLQTIADALAGIVGAAATP